MPPPDFSVLRATFKQFLGKDRYRKFLEAGIIHPLRYWQEQAWIRFIQKYPELAVSDTELADAFNVCPEHEKPLVVGYVEPLDDYDVRIPLEEKTRFPGAPIQQVSLSPGQRRIFFCPLCVTERKEYRKKKKI